MASLSCSHRIKYNLAMLRSHMKSYLGVHKFETMTGCHTCATITPPKDSKTDLVGPADPVSNLRLFHLHTPEDEVPVQRQFRLKRQEVQQWNQEFWIKHNMTFVQERKAFMAANPTKDGAPLSAEEMSVFYKAFLDKNWMAHLSYNFEWYKRNAQLVLLHLRVKLLNFQRRTK